jgi:phosphatidate cytidylyltransferase
MGAERRPRRQETGRQGRRREQQRGQGRELLTRILIAIPAAIGAVVFIDLGGLPFALFMIGVGWACQFELYRMLARWRPVALVGFAALAGMVLAAHYGTIRAAVGVAVATLPVLFLVAAARGHGNLTVAIAGTLLGVYWIGFAVTSGELLRQLPHGDGVVIDVLVGTFVADSVAYVGGRAFGRRLLAPRISPNKTWEGLVCGMLGAIVAVFLAGMFQAWLTQTDALLLGLAVALLGPLGDLFESAVKRDAGAKDAGSLFGPHGGVLDRADAALFTVVAGYYVWYAVLH